MKSLTLHTTASPQQTVNIRRCDSFFSKLRGLMFTINLPKDCGILIADKAESRINSAIHMLFMNFDITVLWLNKNQIIVDKALAKRWRPVYIPKQPAQYVVELHRDRYDDYTIGDKITWEENAV